MPISTLEIRLGDDRVDDILPDDDGRADWLLGREALISGGRIEHRRSSPNAGWYVIGDIGAIGPFDSARAAMNWSTRKRAA